MPWERGATHPSFTGAVAHTYIYILKEETTGLDKNIQFGTIPELDPCLSGRSMLCNPALEKG